MIQWTEKTVLVSDLKPYEKNPRIITKEAYDRLKKSIQDLGFHQRMICNAKDSDGKYPIVGGHQRQKVLEELGRAEVQILVPNRELTRDEFRRLLIQDNLPFGSHDFSMLAADFEIEELIDWGFPEKWLEGATENEKPETDSREEKTPDPPKNPKSKSGDIWICGDHRVMCGDSTRADLVEKLLGDKKIDMIFTDPPYGVDYEGINNDSRAGLEKLLLSVFDNYAKFARQGAPIYVFHSDKCADIFHVAFRKFFHFSSIVIWVKPSLVLYQTDFQSRHEPCMYGWVKGMAHPWYSDRKQTSIWEFAKESVQGHTTPKPVSLIAYAIQNSSRSGELVVDLFGGSGSTLIACEKTQRIGSLMELDPKYCDVIVQRWQDFSGKTAHHADTGKLFDDFVAAL